MKRFLLIILICVFTFSLAPAFAVTPSPNVISYLGQLTKKNGGRLNGTFDITFRVFDVDVGGSFLWEEIQTVVVKKGIFNVNLGEVSAPLPPGFSDIFTGGDNWLEIEIAGNLPMTPRQRIGSNPYSINSTNAVNADNATTADSAAVANDLNCVGCVDNTEVSFDIAETDGNGIALQAENVTGRDIDPRSVTITGFGPVINANGQWVGDTIPETDPTVNALGKASLSCSSGQVAKWNGIAWVCSDDIDTDTHLTDTEFDAYVISNNISTGSHTTDTNTQLIKLR